MGWLPTSRTGVVGCSSVRSHVLHVDGPGHPMFDGEMSPVICAHKRGGLGSHGKTASGHLILWGYLVESITLLSVLPRHSPHSAGANSTCTYTPAGSGGPFSVRFDASGSTVSSPDGVVVSASGAHTRHTPYLALNAAGSVTGILVIASVPTPRCGRNSRSPDTPGGSPRGAGRDDSAFSLHRMPQPSAYVHPQDWGRSVILYLLNLSGRPGRNTRIAWQAMAIRPAGPPVPSGSSRSVRCPRLPVRARE